MTKEYTEFPELEDENVYLAESNNPDRSTIRIESDWFDHEAGEKGRWEKAVGAIIGNDLLGEMELDEGEGSISRRQAIENLQEAGFISIEDQTHAILDFFEKQGAVVFDNGNVKLLTSPEDLSDDDAAISKEGRRYRMLNWAAAMDACIDQMDETLSEFEEAKERLEKNTKDAWDEMSRAQENLDERLRELRALGPGQGIPDPSELASEDRGQYNDLKEDVAFYQSLVEVEEKELVEVEGNVDTLAEEIEKLKSVKGTYERKVSEVRQSALRYELFPGEAVGMAEKLGNVATALANVRSKEELADDMDVDDLQDMASDRLGAAEQVSEAVDEGTMEEAESETSINQ